MLQINLSQRIGDQGRAISIQWHGCRNHLRQIQRLAFGFEFGNVSLRRGAQLIMVNYRGKDRQTKHDSGNDQYFQAAAHVNCSFNLPPAPAWMNYKILKNL